MIIPTFVQEKDANTSTVASISITFTSNNTAGNIIIIGTSSGNSMSGIADTAGNFYQRAVASGFGEEIWYAYNINGGANTVTVTWNGINFQNFCACEYSGVEKAFNPLDQTSIVNGSTTTTNNVGATVTPRFPYELVTCLMFANSSGLTPTGGFHQRYSFNSGQDMFMDLTPNTAASLTPTATMTSTSNWQNVVATFFPLLPIVSPTDAAFFGMT